MPRIDVVVETDISRTSRARQLEGMFDVPAAEKQRLAWSADIPIESFDWNVGLIVGPSGCGKSTVARELFGDHVDAPLQWGGKAVVDDFDPSLSMSEIADVCRAVGFNTVPAWLRPYGVLSNGEKFRVELARRLLECGDPIVVDEFTSVVDRQVGQIGSHAVQKFARKHGRKFVAVTCHHDVIDWLQPDWVFSPAEGSFVRRSLQRRPAIDIEIARVPRDIWRVFAPFHYLTAELHKAATCFALWANGRLAAFSGVLFRPISRGAKGVAPIRGLSRTVTLPDWQGLGLTFVLNDTIASAYKALGSRFRTYPAHPALMRGFDASKNYRLVRRPGGFAVYGSSGSSLDKRKLGSRKEGAMGRPCAVFEYCGPAMTDIAEARRLLSA